MFIGVNSKCAHQVRPPLDWRSGARWLAKHFVTERYLTETTRAIASATTVGQDGFPACGSRVAVARSVQSDAVGPHRPQSLMRKP